MCVVSFVCHGQLEQTLQRIQLWGGLEPPFLPSSPPRLIPVLKPNQPSPLLFLTPPPFISIPVYLCVQSHAPVSLQTYIAMNTITSHEDKSSVVLLLPSFRSFCLKCFFILSLCTQTRHSLLVHLLAPLMLSLGTWLSLCSHTKQILCWHCGGALMFSYTQKVNLEWEQGQNKTLDAWLGWMVAVVMLRKNPSQLTLWNLHCLDLIIC